MNAGIVVLQDGTPCITCDEPLPHPVKRVDFSREDYQLTLVYELENGDKQQKKFEYPLAHDFVELLDEKRLVAIAIVKEDQVIDINIYPVAFMSD